jgi:hypothetical protein
MRYNFHEIKKGQGFYYYNVPLSIRQAAYGYARYHNVKFLTKICRKSVLIFRVS